MLFLCLYIPHTIFALLIELLLYLVNIPSNLVTVAKFSNEYFHLAAHPVVTSELSLGMFLVVI